MLREWLPVCLFWWFHSMVTFIQQILSSELHYMLCCVWPGLTNCFPWYFVWATLLYQLVSFVQKVEPSKSTTLFGIFKCHWFGGFVGKNAATDLGFCSPIYIVAVAKPVASKGFQNTNRDDKMEWTKYLTEGCMTLSEHGILNKFHRLPVPCSWCSFLDLLLVQFGFKYEWLITETHSLFFGFVLQRQIKLR